MPIQFSPVMSAQCRADARACLVRRLDFRALGDLASPVCVVDHIRTRVPFAGAQRHDGFSIATYVFQDSAAGLCGSDSTGSQIVIRPGGFHWSQAGTGIAQELRPAEPGQELHVMQTLIRLGAKQKHADPATQCLGAEHVPEWRNHSGDRARVVVGSFAGLASPIKSADPFILADIRLQCATYFDLPQSHNALIYVVDGVASVVSGGHAQRIEPSQAVALYNIGAKELVQIIGYAHVVVFSGGALCEPVLRHGSIITNGRARFSSRLLRFQVDAASRELRPAKTLQAAELAGVRVTPVAVPARSPSASPRARRYPGFQGILEILRCPTNSRWGRLAAERPWSA